MTDDSYKIANDRELIEMRRGAVEDLAEYRDNLAAIDAEIRQRGLAHTPTDDEREALADAFDEMHRITEGGCDTDGKDVADMVLGLGFRRTEVQEPQGEPTERDIEYRDSPESDEWVIVRMCASESEVATAQRENERRGWQKYRVTNIEPTQQLNGDAK